ncbi:MAG: MATE family efflux transporter [Clostridium sp.]|jgi:MATE efflux family protein|uniref:MATE family efflux transporter n=1 Tax=Anaerotignum lactatifermentans TaxID=160404 RepID=UPI0024B053E0|nr:MATE family efflux transporter [Anaerotignum lactatifermentans]MBS5141146.1 MATE family efflux transporter [Clostridium sp.]
MRVTAMSKNQITEGVIWKQLLFFFFPILLGTLFQQLYNTADTVVVGRFVGTQALAAVGGSTGQIVNLVVNFFVGLASGATVIIARYYGARDRIKLNNALHTAIALSIVGGIVTGIAGILLTPSLLKMMNTPADVIEGSTMYLRIYFAGIIFVFVYNIGSGILRAVGDSKRPLYFLIVCCFLNIFLDILFVVYLKLGVKGAAFATVISQAVSALLVILSLTKSVDIYRLRPNKIRFYKSLLIAIITIGLPAGLQSVMYGISNIIIQISLNSLGTETVAAHTAFAKIDAIYWMISGAFSVSIITFIGQNYGARKFDRMKKSIKVCLLMDLIASLLLTTVMLLAGPYLLRLFTSDQEVIEIGMQIIHIIAPSYALFIFIEILSSSLRGMGNVVVPMLMTCGGVCVLRILWIFIFVRTHLSVTTILMSYPISWGFTAVLFIIYFMFYQKKFFRRCMEETETPAETNA